MGERLYRYTVSLLIFASLGVLFLFGVGLRFSKENVIDTVRDKDGLYGEVVYESAIDKNKYVSILKYDDDAYAPLVTTRFFGMWKLESYFYEDVTKMGMEKTGINGIAYAFDSIIDEQLNFINVSLKDSQDIFIVIDPEASRVAMVDAQDKLIDNFENVGGIFVLNTVKSGYSLVSYDDSNKIMKSTDIIYQEPSMVSMIDLFDGSVPHEFGNLMLDHPEIHLYREQRGYTSIPFVSKDMLVKPTMRLEVNSKVPIYLTSIDGTIKEHDGHKSLTYFKSSDMYILQVYRYWDKRFDYYEMDIKTYNELREKVVGWYYGKV